MTYNGRPHGLLAMIPLFKHNRVAPYLEIHGKILISKTVELAESEPAINDILVIGEDSSMPGQRIHSHRTGVLKLPISLSGMTYSYFSIMSILAEIRERWRGNNEDTSWHEGVVILDPLCPLLKKSHISGAIDLFLSQEDVPRPRQSVISVSPVPNHYHPKKILKISGKGYLDYYDPSGRKIFRRQQLANDDYYYENNAVFIIDPMKVGRVHEMNDQCLAYVIHEPMIRVKQASDLDLILKIGSEQRV